MKLRTLLAAAAMLLGLSSIQSQAAPLAAPAGIGVQSGKSLVDTVQYRSRFAYRGGGYRYGWRGRGAWPWVGIGAGIAAGALIYDYTYRPRVGYYYDTYDYTGPYYYPKDYSGDPRTICARHFKSFEWRSGMYTTYGGERKLCPYLQ